MFHAPALADHKNISCFHFHYGKLGHRVISVIVKLIAGKKQLVIQFTDSIFSSFLQYSDYSYRNYMVIKH